MNLVCWILLLHRYKKYNSKMRELMSKIEPVIAGLSEEARTPEKVMQEMEKAAKQIGKDYTTTVLTLVSAIVKVRTSSPLPEDKKVPPLHARSLPSATEHRSNNDPQLKPSTRTTMH